MSEPITGTPAPANNPQGTGPAPEQPLQTAPTQVPAAQATPPATTPPAPPQADPALQQRLEQAEKAARYFQSQFSQTRQQLQAVTGIAPQVDPLEAKAANYASKYGFDKDQTRNFLAMMQEEAAPLQQRNQQLEAMVQGSAQVDAVMQAAMQKDPSLFQDEQVRQQVYENLRQVALSGNNQYLTPDYAISYGDGVWGSIHRRAQQQPQTAPPTQQPTPQFQRMSFGGPPPGYTPAAPAARQVDPQVAQYNAEIAAHFGLKPKQ